MFHIHTVIAKYLLKVTFRLSILELFFITCILFHFSTDHEGVDITLHVPSSHERQTYQLGNIILLSHQAMRSGSFDA
jgi:preprotein translocase subunit SecG